MKKFFLWMPVAALALASCSNSEIDSVDARQAKANSVNILPAMTNISRGTVYSDANLFSTFQVIANGNFATASDGTGSTQAYNTAVNYSAGSWTLATPLWWGDDATTAKFTAYAGEASGTVSGGKLSFTVPEDVKNQTDLVVAYNEGKRTDFSGGVPLHFRHTLSQVLVEASYADDPDVTTYQLATYKTKTVKVKNVKFVNLNHKGSLTLPTASTEAGETYTAEWSLESGLKTFISNENEITLNSSAASIANFSTDGPMLLLPQTQPATADLTAATVSGTYIAVQVDINDADGDVYPKTAGEYAWVAVPVAIDWKPGYKYTYTLNFSNIAAGKAESAITGWTKGEDVIKNVPHPLNFLVTVEEEWIDGGNTTPAL